MGSTIADYDGDGRLDIFKTNFSDDTSTLYRNNGNGTFDDVTFAAGLGLYTRYLGWGTMFLDFDNDSWPDLLLVNGHVYPEVDKQNLGSSYQEPRILYHNNGNKTFTDMSAQAGPGDHSGSCRARAGDRRSVERRPNFSRHQQHERESQLLVNQVRSANHWIGFRTVGTKSNRDGIGARITVKAGPRILVDEVRSGSSYDSNNDMRIHFGLGMVAKVDWVQDSLAEWTHRALRKPYSGWDSRIERGIWHACETSLKNLTYLRWRTFCKAINHPGHQGTRGKALVITGECQ